MIDEDQLLRKPVIVVGAPRSGTSFLGRVLGMHPSVYYLREPRLTWNFGNDAKSDLLYPKDARPQVIRHIRRTFAGKIRAAGKTRMLEKSPRNSIRMPFVDKIFPDALYIHILRYPVDTVLSIRSCWCENAHGFETVMRGRIKQRLLELNWRRLPHYAGEWLRRAMPRSLAERSIGKPLWGTRLPGLQQMVQEMDLLEVACLQWRTCVESALHFTSALPPDRYRQVQLEDMSPDLIRQLLTFAELDEDPAVFDFLSKTFDATRPSGRRKQVSSEDLAIIRRWTQTTCHWLDEPLPEPDGSTREFRS
ncbi:MAG: sulfotransferase [Pirellulaceae bacterium]|nr:sulfotransferase [Pirellulaceae bacterium]